MEFNAFQNKKLLKKLLKNEEWNLFKFSDVFLDNTKLAKKIKKEDYLKIGKYPIIDQGKKYIAGYTNYTEAIYDEEGIIFGDHTRIIKYVNFPLFLGADGTKLLGVKLKKDCINIKYLYYFLKTIELPSDGYSRHFKYLKEIIIAIPSIKIQNKIVEVLDMSYKLIENRKKQIKELDLLVKSKFIEMFGDPINNPMKWEVKKMKDISVNIMSGNTPKGGEQVYVESGIMFLRSQNVWKNKLLLDDVAYIDQATHNKMKKSSLKNKDILMTKTGRINTENSSLGRAAMFLGEDDSANINGHVYLIRLQEQIINEFVLYILTSKEYRGYIRSVCVGGIDKRQLNKEHIEDFPIIFPPIEKQKKFVSYVNQVDKLKFEMEKSLKELEDNFNSLMQKAFNGELFN
ncbi:restriction endonuclease subunit S [Clostridium perfringens]|uniref:restriction endonuclease subunit S n=1 Tax=Clostridium perfringens TaxID=1502 RepID=UPI0024BC1B7B|nr:restriction endonuclease subunit S [Clostridium perfringens]